MWFLLLSLSVAGSLGWQVPPSTLAPAMSPEWVHSHMVWLRSGHNQSQVLAYVQEYLSHNISVGGTDIDSQWSVSDNDFQWRPDRFPDPQGLTDSLHALGVRVVLWATSLIDRSASNYAFAKEKGFLLNHGATVKWWHGEGAFLDFTYAPALEYWKSLLDNVLVNKSNVDGFKCDGTDPYIFELDVDKLGARNHAGQHVSYREYADLYYGTFMNHSRLRNSEAIIWSRPVDSFKNELYWKFSPRAVSFSGWVGDQDPTFAGLLDAMNNMLHSAWANYISFGSDTGGYRCCGSSNKAQGRTRELLLRWAQVNSLQGLFENGGDNEHRPWMFESPLLTTNIYRQFVSLHTSLSTYLLTASANAYDSGGSLITPVASKPLFNWQPPDSYDYLLGPDIFVSPVLASNVSLHVVHLPNDSEWVDWWNASVYPAGSSLSYPVALSFPATYPVFHRRGKMIAFNPRPRDLFLPLAHHELHLYLPFPRIGDSGHLQIRRHRQLAQEIHYHVSLDSVLHLSISAHPRPLSLRLAMRGDRFYNVTAVDGLKLDIEL